MTLDELRRRYRGALLGHAVGNALGVELEGLSPHVITTRFRHQLRDISPAERDLPWDDDVAQAVILAEALLEGERLDLDDFGGAWFAGPRRMGGAWACSLPKSSDVFSC